jgi:hypothetical protein
MITAGMDWETIGRMPYPDVVSLQDYWKDYPPTHLLVKKVAGAFGVKFPAVSSITRMGRAKLSDTDQQLVADPSIKTKYYAQLPPTVQDFINEVNAGQVKLPMPIPALTGTN